MQAIFKVVFLSEPSTITKKDGTTCQKQTITLRELGGKFADQYVATWLGEQMLNINEGATIAASLRFSARTYDGQDYQDILLQELVVLDHYIKKLPTIPVI